MSGTLGEVAPSMKKRSKKEELAEKRGEYEKLRAELKASKAAQQTQKPDLPPDELLTPLQQQRLKFVNRNKDKSLGKRQDSTLERLQVGQQGVAMLSQRAET